MHRSVLIIWGAVALLSLSTPGCSDDDTSQNNNTQQDAGTNASPDAAGDAAVFVGPGPVTDLRVVAPQTTRLTLRWTAPDMAGGAALAYQIRYARRRIRSWMWEDPDLVEVPSSQPGAPGTLEELVVDGLDPESEYFFAIRCQAADSSWHGPSHPAAGVTLPTLSGRDIFVSTAGDDSHSGDPGDPLRTVEAACAASTSGDVVRVLAGTYLQDRCSVRSGTAIVSEDGPRAAIIDGEGQTQHLVAIWGDDDVVIDGFELRNTGGGSDGNDIIWIDGDGAAEVSYNIRLRRLYVHDAGEAGDCIKVTNHVDGFTLEHSRLHSAYAPPSGEAEELLDMKLTRNATIRSNWFYHLPGSNEGAMAYSKTDCENILFEGNIFGPQSEAAGDSALGGGWSSSTTGYNTDGLYVINNLFLHAHYSAVGAYGARNEYILHNVFYNCGRGGGGILRVQEGGAQTDSENVYFINNLIVDDGGQLPDPILYQQSIAGLTNFVTESNLYWNNGSAIPSGGIVDPNGETGFLSGDPLLAAPASPAPGLAFDAVLDLFMMASDLSPLIDSGLDVTTVTGAPSVDQDILGSPRPVGAAVDRGAFEGAH